MENVLVSDGPFLMGADKRRDHHSDSEEQPQRKVFIPSFRIQKTPVTVRQWRLFLAETGFEWDFLDKVAEVSPGDLYPITYVSWFDCWEFVEWLRKSRCEKYSLPTEAQWEKACRGEDGRLYPWGHELPDWVEESKGHQNGNRPVGSRPERRSPYGCLDMWTNVSEWCADWYDQDYYHDHFNDIFAPKGPSRGEYKIFRGGSPLDAGWPRCTWRGFQRPDYRHDRLGFRVVQNI